jgi:hypothetical protein
VSAAFFQQLDVSVVRRAWRKMAVASHPDASRREARGTPDGKLFVEASRAYELLMGHLLSRPAQPRPPRRGAAERRAPEREKRGPEKRGPAGTAAERRGAPLFFHGSVPRRRLRLAEYLYYSGRVSWQSLISAIVWQRASQPRFGELARELRNISAPDLAKILGSRLRQEHTGEAAQRLRLLTADQVERILRLQRARRRLIGRYFVENERMSSEALTSILFELYRHNAKWGRAQ